MRQIGLAALGAAFLFAGVGCEPDYCSCSYKPQPTPITGETRSWPNMWCPVGNPENDARIVKLLSERCIHVDPFRPWPRGNSNLQVIWISFLEQQQCAKKLLFEAASRGEIAVVFGPGPGDGPPTTQTSTTN